MTKFERKRLAFEYLQAPVERLEASLKAHLGFLLDWIADETAWESDEVQDFLRRAEFLTERISRDVRASKEQKQFALRDARNVIQMSKDWRAMRINESASQKGG